MSRVWILNKKKPASGAGSGLDRVGVEVVYLSPRRPAPPVRRVVVMTVVVMVVAVTRVIMSAAWAAAVVTSSWVAEAAMSLSTCEPRFDARRRPE